MKVTSLKPVAPMRIEKHRLFGPDGKPVRYVESPNRGGRIAKPLYLVVHYTAGVSINGTVSWFLNRDAKASAHLVIDREGQIAQMVPFDHIAWHAGSDSQWEDREDGTVVKGLNKCSIGIELVNVGRLFFDKPTKRWMSKKPARAWDTKDVMQATHKNESQACGWLRYTDVQLQLALEIGKLLARQYRLRDVLGHEDISAGRKTDPGPAFPMDDFREDVLRATDLDPRV